MRFLLDTSTCIEHLRGRAPAVSRRLEAEHESAAVCSVVVAELLYGVMRGPEPAQRRERLDRFVAGLVSLPFDDSAADHAARIRTELAGIGKPIGPYDLLIAAIALANDLTVVTRNSAEFERVRTLHVEDWAAA